MNGVEAPDRSIDILMVTHNRAGYTRQSLSRLIAACDESMRVWLWHNGEDVETLEVLQELCSHPRVHRFQHSPENKRLHEPINWFWSHAEGRFLAFVNDDSLVPDSWGQQLRRTFEDVPELGVLACWHFREDDFDYELAAPKIKTFPGGHQILRNCWVQGSGCLIRRECVTSQGLLRPNESWPTYCMRLAAAGWVLGWPYPFIYMEHMDDPRSPYTLLRTEEDFRAHTPLTAQRFGIRTIDDRITQIRSFARECQTATIDPRAWVGWRRRARRLARRARSLIARLLPAASARSRSSS
jgi:cellulose synthase/poly-beta-1,6-N-acetylglucosamine synthase-like glycosyltransferase